MRVHPHLPVFLLAHGKSHVVYAPGHLAVVTPAEAETIGAALPSGKASEDSRAGRIAGRLCQYAERAVERWNGQIEQGFAPECLTVYFNGPCDLACGYCYAAPANRMPDAAPANRMPDAPPANEKALLAAARLVARCCARKEKKRFHLVLHGGGEPTLQWDVLVGLIDATKRIARDAGLDWFGYIATNGVVPEARVRWLASNVDLIGISCDGPSDIQDRQRPLAGGGPSSPFVERTARTLVQMGARFTVRATITRQTVERQTEVVAYMHERLGATRMRFEPVYRARNSGPDALGPGHAEWFLDCFLAAQREARRRGCDLELSGARLDELHGPYCNILRDVLQVTPDGGAMACFLPADSQRIGCFDEASGEFLLDEQEIAARRRSLKQIPRRCWDCLNIYHCARGCPDECYLSGDPGLGEAAGFRCRLQRMLAEAWIFEAAGLGWRAPGRPLNVLLDDAPQSVNRTNILGQWHAAAKRYAIERRLMPLPIWARRGFEEDGSAAWRRLRDDLSATGSGSAVSLYVHVPFCDRRCGFCDCYSLPLGPRSRHNETKFEQALLDEMDAWAGIEALAKRPVTTVHFGGGTPNCLSAEVFNRILERIRTRFGVAAHTEWALESRTSLLTDEHLEQLWRWGFRRLHVGVQTLEDEARKSIGRRESGDTAVLKVARALELGFVVSVDILFGAPRQTLTGLVATLDRLVALGVHGFSLYGLHLSKRNSRFLERLIDPAGDPLRDYALFQTASQCLARGGYRRNHFTHWARVTDRNLYYTHPQRGEDLLGLGPTADGVFGSYHYRHPELEEYLRSAATAFPGLEGGVAETLLERRVRPAVTQLMGGRISGALVESLNAASLLEKWRECGFLEADSRGEQFSLTANGVWFLSSMLDELSETAGSHLPAESLRSPALL